MFKAKLHSSHSKLTEQEVPHKGSCFHLFWWVCSANVIRLFLLQTCNQLEVLGGPASRKGPFGEGDSQTMSEIWFLLLTVKILTDGIWVVGREATSSGHSYTSVVTVNVTMLLYIYFLIN